LLGSLLYMNVQDRQQQPQPNQRNCVIASCSKLVLAIVLLVTTKFLYFMTGTSLYLMADAFVSMRRLVVPQDQKQ
jgi:hypothetical protein